MQLGSSLRHAQTRVTPAGHAWGPYAGGESLQHVGAGTRNRDF